MRLILVRHGQSVENAKGIIHGVTEGTLSPLGIEQSRRLAGALEGEKVDVMFSSDLRRAIQTAEAVAERRPGVPWVRDSLLRERSYGIFEGRPMEAIRAERSRLGLAKQDFRPEGGESYGDVRKRAEAFLGKVEKAYGKRTVLIVGHGEFLLIMISAALRESMEKAAEGRMDNASISILEIHGANARLVVMNDTKHLEGLV
jgi:probable phosphoglycerate mutase